MTYVIQHERRGIYIKDELVPRFSWSHGKSEGKRFATQAAAREFIREHFEQSVAGRCTVEEVKEPNKGDSHGPT